MSTSTTSRFGRMTLAAAAAAAVIAPAGVTRAENTDPLTQLRIVCTMKTGEFYITPYHLARCQDTRSNKGFDQERVLCVELGGSFLLSTEFSRNNRATWACVAPGRA